MDASLPGVTTKHVVAAAGGVKGELVCVPWDGEVGLGPSPWPTTTTEYTYPRQRGQRGQHHLLIHCTIGQYTAPFVNTLHHLLIHCTIC